MFQNIPLLGILAIAAAAIIITIIAVIYNKTVSFTKDGVVVNGDGQRKPSRHSRCNNLKDVVICFRNRDDYREKMSEIKYRHMPKEIMDSAEDAVERVVSMMESLYLSLLKEQGVTSKKELAGTQHFRSYRVILRAIQPQLLTECRRMMNENGWIKKEQDGTFDEYVNRKTADFMGYMTNLLNEYYLLDSPSRTELYDHNMKHAWNERGLVSTIQDTIKGFLKISKVWQKEIDAIQKKMDDEMNSLLT